MRPAIAGNGLCRVSTVHAPRKSRARASPIHSAMSPLTGQAWWHGEGAWVWRASAARQVPVLKTSVEPVVQVGGTAGNGSGDIFLAFSTANSPAATATEGLQQAAFVPNDRLDGLFEATVLATEEAIINALVAARTMTGVDGNRLQAIDHARLQEVLRRHNRLVTVRTPLPSP